MPKPNPGLYDLKKTTFWFAIVSIVLFVSLVALVAVDYVREWKGYQRKFIELKTQKARDELKAAAAGLDKAKIARLEADLKKAREKEALHRGDEKKLRKEIQRLEVETVKVRSDFQNFKQYADSYRYFYEDALNKGQSKKAESYKHRIENLEKKLARAKSALEDFERKGEETAARLLGFSEEILKVQKEVADTLKETERLERSLEAVRPTLARGLLNAPMIDFLAPTLRIQQVVLENLYDDYHFIRVQKVDRCTTCHLGIDQKGFEDAPQPFRTHPRMELFVGSDSPHPVEKVGCTVCHGGNGHSVGFTDSAHMPDSEEEAKAWQKKYHWRELEKWDAKMLPTPLVEAACAKCHRDTVQVPEAPRLNEGRDLARVSGCFNCHLVKGFENQWKVGPDLGSVKDKLSEDWIVRWLQDPKAFRPSTRMPRVFHLSNTNGPEDRERNIAAIDGIAAYLVAHSDEAALLEAPGGGDAKRGEQLAKEVGCLGCHSLPPPQGAGGQGALKGGDFVPELSGLGSKVRADWLYSWLKDPKNFSHGTRMPNLRLTDDEARDITAYLLSFKNPEFETSPAPRPKPEVLDAMVMMNLEKKMRTKEAQAELAKMSRDDKRVFLGRQSILQQGCFGCHNIRGFEDAKRVGAELSTEGRKDIHQFDFGHTHIDHTRDAWIFQKLKEPRIFDKGRVKDYLDKLRMPDFGFTDDEARALTTFVLSLTDEPIPLEMQKRLDAREMDIENGRHLVKKLNCQGCHTLDGKEGDLRKLMVEDQGNAPPIIDGEGKKVQEKWLHGFLKSPTTIRPWLKARMPTFAFTEEETAALVRYFAALDKETVSYKGYEIPATTPERLEAGKVLFDKFQCAKCHQVTSVGAGALGSSFLAPELALTQERLKPNWVSEWLKDPQTLMPGTMMPSFFPDGQTPLPELLNGDTEAQIQAIRDHLYRHENDIINAPIKKETST